MTAAVLTLSDLVGVYLESLTPQVHPLLTERTRQIVEAYEAAMGVTIPRQMSAVTARAAPLFMLFESTKSSALALRTPTSGWLEGGLVYSRLNDVGEVGRRITEALSACGSLMYEQSRLHVQILAELLSLFNDSPPRPVTLDDVMASDRWPADLPASFDPFDSM